MQRKIPETHGSEIYRETIVFTLGRAVIALFVVLALLFLGMFIYQLAVEPIGSKPAPDWYMLIMFLFFLCMTLVIFNFGKLDINATSQSLTVRYGMFKQVVRWEDVSDFYADEATALNYGGFGIRIGNVNGKSRLVYNVIGGSRVVLGLKKGKFKEFVFSTRNPEAVMGVVRERMGQ